MSLLTEEINERHTAANMTVRLQQAIQQWNIDGKVSAIVTDNARNAINAMRNIDTHVTNVEVTCAAHTLQLCVMDVLKRELVNDLFSKVRNVFARFKHSNIAATNLELKQEQLGMKKLKLIQSCMTRWDSSDAMIERLITNRNAVINVLMDAASLTAQQLRRW